MADNHYDVIIIGTGAGGGTLAYRLAPSGKRILLLERGGYVPREKQNWDSRAVEVENRYHIKEPWYDRDGREFHAGTHYFVGGNTKFYGAALIRLRRQDFGQVAHHGGVSPAWPIAYEDLEPYYTEAEHLYQVHGVRGSDPTEPPASAPYLHPPPSHEPPIQQLVADLTRIRPRPFPMPRGGLPHEPNRRPSSSSRAGPSTRPRSSSAPRATSTPAASPTAPASSAATTCAISTRCSSPSPASRTRPASRRPGA